ncbi:MAG: aminotransferase class IV [Candidatus Aureabacteria bacterium]|nr:aminotransferase class IV [Candidatus Auribacterota bacterium]
MELTLYHNGHLLKDSELVLSIYDQGFIYGDGVYSELRVYNRKPFKLKEHLDQFFYSAEKLELKIDLTEKTIEKTIQVLLDLNAFSDAMATIIVTRGELSPGRPGTPCPNVFIMTRSLFPLPDEIHTYGANLALCEMRACPDSILDRQIYTLSRQQQTLSLIQLKKKQAFEGIFINMEGCISEGIQSNVFIIKDQCIITPDLICGVQNRVIRATVLDLVRENGYAFSEGFLRLQHLFDADECFIAGTEFEVLPVIRVEDRTIGNGRPGKITKLLMQAYRSLTLGTGQLAGQNKT